MRPPLAALERLTAHSYLLLAQLTAVKTMLLMRRGRLNAEQIRTPLREAADAIARELTDGLSASKAAGGGVTAAAPLDSAESDSMSDAAAAASAGTGDTIAEPAALAPGPIALPDPFEQDLSPWLLRRLHLATGIAAQTRAAAAQATPTPTG